VATAPPSSTDSVGYFPTGVRAHTKFGNSTTTCRGPIPTRTSRSISNTQYLESGDEIFRFDFGTSSRPRDRPRRSRAACTPDVSFTVSGFPQVSTDSCAGGDLFWRGRRLMLIKMFQTPESRPHLMGSNGTICYHGYQRLLPDGDVQWQVPALRPAIGARPKSRLSY
jgi:hypothetical protein